MKCSIFTCFSSGETMANKEGRIQGHIDIPLNDLGKEQARRVSWLPAFYSFTQQIAYLLINPKLITN